MKNIIPICFLLAICFHFSCDQVNPNLKDGSPLKDDLEKLEKIDTLVKKIDKNLKQAEVKQIPINLVSPKDDLSYMPSEDGTGRLDLKIFPENTEAWATFYLKNEEIVLFRYREWIRAGKPKAQEVYTYFEDDLIIYSENRLKTLKEGEPPVSLRLEDFEKSVKSRKELYLEFKKYWEPAEKAYNEFKANQ